MNCLANTVHMKYQGLFSWKNIKKEMKISSATVVVCAIRVNTVNETESQDIRYIQQTTN